MRLLTANERLQKPRLLHERVQRVLARRPRPLQRLAVERASQASLDKLPPGKMLPRLLSLIASLPLAGIWPVTATLVKTLEQISLIRLSLVDICLWLMLMPVSMRSMMPVRLPPHLRRGMRGGVRALRLHSQMREVVCCRSGNIMKTTLR